MRTTLERELKLDVEPGFVLPDLGGTPLPARVFTSTYYDTADLRLLRSGITLRRRVEGDAGAWQLKLPADGGRHELEEPGTPTRPPEDFLRLLPALLRGGASLEPVAQMRTRRAGVAVDDGADRVEVVVDRVSVLEDGRVASSFAELEAEVVEGTGAALPTLGKALRRAGGRPSEGASKLARALGAGARDREQRSGDPAPRVRRFLVDQYEAMVANDPGVRLGLDTEALHRFRVATRRARALLRAARGIVAADWAEPVRAELAWLGGLLGPVRDADVLLEHLDAEAATLDGDDARAVERLRARLSAQRDQSRAALLEGMSGERYLRLLDTLERSGEAPVTADGSALREVARRAFKGVRRAVKALPEQPTDAELHRVRIAAKRARYAAELGGPALGQPGARLVERARAVQNVIGEHQDACVAEARIRELSVRSGSATGIAAGRLVERERLRKRAARRAFPRAWRALDKAGRATFR